MDIQIIATPFSISFMILLTLHTESFYNYIFDMFETTYKIRPNKLAKLRRHASRVHYAKIHFGLIHFGKNHLEINTLLENILLENTLMGIHFLIYTFGKYTFGKYALRFTQKCSKCSKAIV